MSPVFRRRLTAALAAVLLATLAGDSAVMADREKTPAVPISVAVARRDVTESAKVAERRDREREQGVRALFDARARAIRARDRKAFLALVDPKGADFRRRQGEVFDSLLKLDFKEWTYSPKSGESYSPTSIDWQKYVGADDVWLPVLVLRYQLRGFDTKPVGRRVVYTVVRRGSHWYVAEDADLEKVTSTGTSVRVDPWENGPISVEHSAHGLVIGHPQDAKAVAGIVREVEGAVKHVSSFVGKSWGEKVVIVLPGDKDELDRILESPQVPFDFAAIARPLATAPGDDEFADFAGSRVVINPDGFKVGKPFTRVLIRHEMTHVAMFERTGPASPEWLIEGLAEYVGAYGSPFSTARYGSALGALVDKQGVPNHLPSDSDFGLINDAGIGYNSGWLLCRYIAQRYGRAKLLALYDAMGTPTDLLDESGKLAKALERVLGTTEAALLAAWRPYVRAAVGDLTKLLSAPPGYREDDTGELDAADLAEEKSLSAKQLTAYGVERAGEGIWYVGSDEHPAKMAIETLVVSRDATGAAAAEKAFAGRFRKFDPTGRAIPGGRMYFVGVRIGGQHYNEVAAVLRSGIVVIEVRVAVPGTGDPSDEVRTLAAKQLAKVASV